MSFLRTHGFELGAPCGGLGVCGKCRVRMRIGRAETSVLACKTALSENCTVWLDTEDADLSWNDARQAAGFHAGRPGFGVAVDLGTTTVAASLFDLQSGRLLGSHSEWNVQRSYGADVITRIGYCIDRPDGLSTLCSAIRQQLHNMVDTLCRKHGITPNSITELFLAGNTVMQHIFAGVSPASIAAAPFTPATYFDDGAPIVLDEIPVRLFPCVAGYVGGDITAGLLSCKLYQKPGKALFIDVGTNGEMVLGGADGFIACAVASGPAFEGAGMSCGMPAAFGAINKVSLTGDSLTYEVLGGGEATGLCGSGILDLCACLLELGYIDESGCLEANEDGEAVFCLTDSVYITQRDIRQLQLAKAAVSAGIRLLMQATSTSFDDIDALYLAGGFGNRLRPESAVRIGMLPAEMLEKIIPCGNSSLQGTQQALLDPTLRQRLHEIKSKCTYLELSLDPSFNECFVEEMSFPEY